MKAYGTFNSAFTYNCHVIADVKIVKDTGEYCDCELTDSQFTITVVLQITIAFYTLSFPKTRLLGLHTTSIPHTILTSLRKLFNALTSRR